VQRLRIDGGIPPLSQYVCQISLHEFIISIQILPIILHLFNDNHYLQHIIVEHVTSEVGFLPFICKTMARGSRLIFMAHSIPFVF
jgi:hypothetical protein